MWAGERLGLAKAVPKYRRLERSISVSLVPVGFLGPCLEPPGGFGRFVPCVTGAHDCGLRHIGWEKRSHGPSSRPEKRLLNHPQRAPEPFWGCAGFQVRIPRSRALLLVSALLSTAYARCLLTWLRILSFRWPLICSIKCRPSRTSCPILCSRAFLVTSSSTSATLKMVFCLCAPPLSNCR